METGLVVFDDKPVRRVMHNNEWWFVITDVVAALSDSVDSSDYIKDMRRRDKGLSKRWGQIATPLSIETPGGKQRLDCANTEGIFRIIQSISSPKAELFKRRLAKMGCERVQEIEDPELAILRTCAIYKAKGYSDAWIGKRMRGIAVRDELTAEWKNGGVGNESEYNSLSSEISKAAFGMAPGEHKQIKGLNRENLRDHMTDLELIFSMLGEAATTEIARRQDTQGFSKNKTAARKGGRIAGGAREKLEIETGERVVSSGNHLAAPERGKRLEKKP